MDYFKDGAIATLPRDVLCMKPNYRRCVSCRQVALKQELWQIVRTYPAGELQLDQGMGRSAYLCPQVQCLQTAQKKNLLRRSLRASVPEAIYQALWQRLSTTQTVRESKHIEITPPDPNAN